MSHKITIGEIVETGKPFTLPVDAVTSTLVVYGGKGMGKTNFGSVLAEELSRASLRFAVIDPMGVWWGLRHSVDGKGPGVECLILGGVHGDIPIEPTGGAVVADLVVDEDVNVIIDISRHVNGESWSIPQKLRFAVDFGKQLHKRQSGLKDGRRREPLMLLIDEAARFVAQTIFRGNDLAADSLSVYTAITEEGRNFGLGVAFLTQRSARLAKAVAELADVMIAFRTIGPNSVKAVTDWLGEHKATKEINEAVQVVRKLPRGSALVVSPGWLEFEGVVAMRARETFDSSATPKAGERAKKITGKAAKPDLAKYAALMAETIERAKSEDPRELRKRVADLEKQLAAAERSKAGASASAAAGGESRRTIADLTKQVNKLRGAIGEVMKLIVQINAAGFGEGAAIDVDKVRKALEDVAGNIATIAEQSIASRNRDFARLKHEATRTLANLKKLLDGDELTVNVKLEHSEKTVAMPLLDRPRRRTTIVPPASNGDGDGSLPKGERAMLGAIAQYPDGVERETLTVLLGYKRTSRDEYIKRLAARGFVETQRGGRISATGAGVAALGSDYEPLPTGEDLRRHWLGKLPEGEKRILEMLISEYPAAVDREQLGEAIGYKRTSRDEYIKRLKARRLVDLPRAGEVVAAADLFDGVRA